MLFFPIITILGCEQFHLFVEEDTGIDTAEETIVQNPTIDINWGSNSIDIEIQNGSGYDFEFGITESTTSCSIDTEYGCWTAEDCLSGYITPQETFSHPPYCHTLLDSGGSLTYSSSLMGVITGTVDDYVIPGERTAFPAPTEELSYEFSVTYILKATSTGADPVSECWTWGVNPDHFSSENCKAPIPISIGGEHGIWSLGPLPWMQRN